MRKKRRKLVFMIHKLAMRPALASASMDKTTIPFLISWNKRSVLTVLMGSHHNYMNPYDEYLHTLLEVAAGADAILQANKLGELMGLKRYLTVFH